MAQRATARQMSDIPDKLYFRIGDVARICGVEAYVLRFWETEFPQLRPGKSGTGQRLYRRREVEFALRIKNLLHDQGYTIAGARLALKSERDNTQQPQAEMPFARSRAERERFDKLRTGLLAILETLERDPSAPPPANQARRRSGRLHSILKTPSPELF